jgi:hypothetical protein
MGRTSLLAMVVLYSGCALVAAQGLDPVRKAIDSYRAAIELAQKNPSRGQLEAAFNTIEPLRQALVSSRNGAGSALESLSDQEFTALGRKLAGLVVNREEVVFVEPDVVFFGRLAARGDRADRAFFTALSSTYPASAWPVYIEQQTDYSGCTRFGSGTLVSTYVAWATFRRQYPKRYEQASVSHLDDIVEALTGSTCACGDRASVEGELTEFLRRAEGRDTRAKVEARLLAVRRDRANIRFACTSG